MSTKWDDNSWQKEFLEMKFHSPADVKLLTECVKGSRGAMVTVPMKSEEQCEQAGKEVTTFKEWEGDGVVLFVYNCIKGK